MKRFLFTLTLLILAIACYVVGLRHMAAGFFIAGAGLELWFWWRVLRRNPTSSK